jgi:hypothetical protein
MSSSEVCGCISTTGIISMASEIQPGACICGESMLAAACLATTGGLISCGECRIVKSFEQSSASFRSSGISRKPKAQNKRLTITPKQIRYRRLVVRDTLRLYPTVNANSIGENSSYRPAFTRARGFRSSPSGLAALLFKFLVILLTPESLAWPQPRPARKFPRRHALASFHLQRFQPQRRSFAAHHQQVDASRHDRPRLAA